MARFIDARILVRFAVPPGARDVVLPALPAAVPHPAGCVCCTARCAAAPALDRLFLDRVCGRIPWFDGVVVPDEDPDLRDALVADPVLAARFRLG